MLPHSEPSPGSHSFRQGESTAATVLVAEDPFINNFLRTVLQRHGHKVVVTDYSQGSDLMRAGGVKADVIVTNKPEAFLPFAENFPMVYIAANPDPAVALHFHACRVLRKPFRYEDLLDAVEDLTRAS
jgi:DNA-binding NtrC family response regulator